MNRFLIAAAVTVAAALAAPAAAHATTPDKPCTAYIYQGSVTNLCDDHPGIEDVDCAQIGKPVVVLDANVDPWKLDTDGDLVACEKPKASASASASASAKATAATCAAYLYTGTKQSLCQDFGTRIKLTCAEAKYRVTLVDKAKDPWGLDGSGAGSRGVVGVGCESNPLKPKPVASASASSKASSSAAGVTTTTEADAGQRLPVTGPGAGTWLLVGLVTAAAGVLYVLVRRRKVRWQA